MDLGNAAETECQREPLPRGHVSSKSQAGDQETTRKGRGDSLPPAAATAPRLGGSPSPLGSRSKSTYANSYFREKMDVTDICIQMY